MATATLNGRPPRKQLSDQLDRLDTIIDCLADALPDAVRDAVRDGTQAALKQVLLDLLTDPTVLARIRQAPLPSPEPVPTRDSFGTRFRARLSAMAARLRVAATTLASEVRARATATGTTITQRLRSWSNQTRSVMRAFDLAWQVKRGVLVALGVGASIALLASLSHTAAIVLAATGATSTSVAVQIGIWARRSLRTLTG